MSTSPTIQPPGTLTSVPGLRVGHADTRGSGCTVVIGPFRAAVEVRGLATGSRELGVLAPEHLVPRVDALLLTGGSAFGLAAADGVVSWLEERGRGYPTGAARVPIVPAAVIYDLAEGRPRPDAALGRRACDGADDAPVATGRVGAGAGATVGKLRGPEGAAPGGLGSAARRSGAFTVGALAVVNAVGNVLDGDGRIVAGVRGEDGSFLDAAALLDTAGSGEGPRRGSRGPLAGTNTTLAVVGTDAPLGPIGLTRMARVAVTALARRIDPVHTPFDGDIVFALSTAEEAEELDPETTLALGVAAREALADAVTGAVVA